MRSIKRLQLSLRHQRASNYLLNTTHTTKDRATRTPLTTGRASESWCSETVSSLLYTVLMITNTKLNVLPNYIFPTAVIPFRIIPHIMYIQCTFTSLFHWGSCCSFWSFLCSILSTIICVFFFKLRPLITPVVFPSFAWYILFFYCLHMEIEMCNKT